MTNRLVRNIRFDDNETTVVGPTYTDDRYKNSHLTELGPAFMVFERGGYTDRWTLGYEEVLYVVSGELMLDVVEGDEEYRVIGTAGDVITIAKGATLRYGGTMGTRVFVTFTPLNWQDSFSAA
jgi:ethanolamine utilization protein EutQ (cupin superfamily)